MGVNKYECVTIRYGYSLLELLVVMALVGILLSVAVPSYQAQRESALRYQVMTYLLNIQIQQAYFVMNEGTYRSSSQLPVFDNGSVSVTEDEASAGDYSITATLLFLSEEEACRKLTVTSLATEPLACWR